MLNGDFVVVNKGSFSNMKSTNIKLILNVIHRNRSISRVQIAEQTGLTGATVTNLTGELIKSGIIIETAQGSSTGGRRPVILEFNSGEYAVGCVYISSKNLEFAVTDFDCGVVYYTSVPVNKKMTPDDIADVIYDNYVKCINSISKKMIAMGIGLHGTVDYERGNWLFAPNLEWSNIEICRIIHEKLGIPVFADNDVKLMAKGEKWYGVAKNVSDFALMYVGEGVGGAAMINGELYRGVSNVSGEIGHCTVDINGDVCSCGNRGCLQTKINKSAMLKAAKQLGVSVSSCDEITEKALNGDDNCNKIIENEAMYLSVGVKMLVNMYNPKLVIINSDIKDFEKVILDKLRELCKMVNSFGNECEIKYGSDNSMSVIKGATAMILKEIFDDPFAYFN